ncbi:phosphatidylserine synthase-like [Artemia franciscana]|uniref:Phosphatidylserine synthase n=1 Tax=Artemia franciscana TaxID=6661 RepID=A0AA88HR60_ARTSF|nr:hypothetical protein QYM36_009559 [Artemia franciscana]KAK2713719.1 hypothetical protein QYM36_009559 [Artemia franciscana]
MGKASQRKHANSVSDYEDHFHTINEKPVDDISIDYFYKPHTLTLLTACLSVLIYSSFTRDDEADLRDNIWAGMKCVLFIFLIISALAFPNGPFTRPHPVIWRMVFGLSVLYLVSLCFILFQSYSTVRNILEWLDPELEGFRIDMDKEYGVNCSDINLSKLWGHMDVFAFSHFFGWLMKALIVRHYGILWTISVMWEITEIAFAHLLPNFVECWWDAIILDVLLCNGLGIYAGMQICKFLEMREYKWESIRSIQTAKGKIKRAVLQFTPESWTYVRWLDPKCTYMRFLAICQLTFFFQISELNTFFLKHIFELPPGHPLNVIRLGLIGLFVAPSMRQYYSYVTDTLCKRYGTQCWIYSAIMCVETIICLKFGWKIFTQTQIRWIVFWLLVQMALSTLCVYGCVRWHSKKHKNVKMSSSGNPVFANGSILNNKSLNGKTTIRQRTVTSNRTVFKN